MKEFEKNMQLFSMFRKAEVVKALVKKINRLLPKGRLKIMHVCGSHEHTVTYYGLRAMLSHRLELVAGPGCPVCVCSTADIREAIEVSKEDATLCTFGDMIRDRTPYGALEDAKRNGADIRMVYSPLDALKIAKENPNREVVFFGVGFETSSAPIASLLFDSPPDNFSMLTSLKRTSPAVESLLKGGEISLNGVIAPGHVSTIVGGADWLSIPASFGIPTVVAGFEPVDVLLAIIDILDQIRNGKAELGIEYKRLVRYRGNEQAQLMLSKVFDVKDAHWRALGKVPQSGYFLKQEFAAYDARKRFNVNFDVEVEKDVPPGCKCHLVVTGKAYPSNCSLFNNRLCTPEEPRGPCMVSGEGTCHIWYRYGSADALREKMKSR